MIEAISLNNAAVERCIKTPRNLYVYNDFSHYMLMRGNEETYTSLTAQLTQVLRANEHVTFIDIDRQIQALASQSITRPSSTALALGKSGYRVALALHEHTGWFSSIQPFAVARRETCDGSYQLISTNHLTLQQQLQAVSRESLAIVDDTIYSGLTMYSLLTLLTTNDQQCSHVFALCATSASLAVLAPFCPVTTALELKGKLDEEVSIIRASHLFMPGAIRRENAPELAFFQRPSWIKAWFSGSFETILAICEQLYMMEPVTIC